MCQNGKSPKNNTTKNLYIYLLLLLPFHVSGQQSIEKSAPENGQGQLEYVARDYVRLLPGYSYKATGNNTLRIAIDEHIVIQTTYQNNPPSPNRQLNTSYAVGSTAGSADVTPTGAATYQIPIAVPPGTGGVQPNLSIVYNSQTGNGLLGYGWNLAGISSISRCGKTIYHDGKAEEVKLNASDNLMLDGQRLVLIPGSGANLTIGAKYRTEIETFSDITCFSGYATVCFQVVTKDGWTLIYGGTADSHIEGAGGFYPQHWLLYMVTDPSGNYMQYTYTKDNTTGEFRLKQIDYTGNSLYMSNHVAPYNKVEFFYETRTDHQTAYSAGKMFKQTVLLKRIKSSAANSKFREYRFNYAKDGLYSKLTEVEEYGQNGERFNSTAIYWNNTTRVGNQYDINIARGISSNDYQVMRYGDFNGDGKVDFISYRRNAYGSSTAYMYFSDDNGGYSKFPSNGFTVAGTSVDFLIADIDGDGLNDILNPNRVPDSRVPPLNPPNLTCYAFQSSKNAFRTMGTFYDYQGYSDILIGDYDGDGKTEILKKTTCSVHKHVSGISSSWSGIASGGITNWGTPPSSDPWMQRYLRYLQQFDVNGNGKTNILITDASGCKVYELQGSSFVELTGFRRSDVTSQTLPIVGDFNGDGLSDLLMPNYILFSTGTGFYQHNLSETVNISYSTHLINYNGDNITDIANVEVNANNKLVVKIGVFNGQKFDFTTYTTNINTTNGLLWDYVAFEDVDGDGFSELIYDHDPLKLTIVSFNNPDNLLVKQIKNGLNNETEFLYSQLTKNAIYNETDPPEFDTYYQLGWSLSDPKYPVRWQPTPFKVVKSLETYAEGYSETTDFVYKNIRTHVQGKGFLCFQQIEASNSKQNRKIITNYDYNRKYFNVYLTQQKVTNYSGNTDISTVTFTNDTLSLGSKRIFPYMSKQVATDHLTGLSVTTDYHYIASDDGNPWKITETRGNLITETTNTWAAVAYNYQGFPGLIKQIKNGIIECTVKRTCLQSTFTETTGFGYDDVGRLTSRTNFKGTTKAVTTTYSNYDKFGNPKTIISGATNCPNVNMDFAYDATGRFVTSKTDAIGIVETQYDIFGRIASVTGINGLTTSFEYDGFGNLVKETTPTGTVNYTMVWDINYPAAGLMNQLWVPHAYRVDRTESGTSSQSTWYNPAGQETKASVKGFSGDVFTIKKYHLDGRLYLSSLPGYGNPVNQYTEYNYDALGRLQTVSSVPGTTTYTYTGLTTKVNYPDGTFQTTVLNNSGLVESVTDGNASLSNVINYAYNSIGKPVTITAVGSTTNIRYDSRGYQIRLKDPNMTDTIRYEYDAYGMLRSHKNARGQTTTFTYDAAGRVLTEVSPEMNLAYFYAASGAGKGQLEYIKTGNIELRKIEYNELGLPSQITEKIDTINHITKYSYDNYGRLLQKESP